jgi:hypothetical protein
MICLTGAEGSFSESGRGEMVTAFVCSRSGWKHSSFVVRFDDEGRAFLALCRVPEIVNSTHYRRRTALAGSVRRYNEKPG